MRTSVGLFAGIGGMELGMRTSGFHPAMLCEIQPEAQTVLCRRFEGVDLRPDVRKIRSLPGEASLLTAGFPCQDLSSSGHKRGISGLRSSLVGEVFRLLARSRCEWVLLENVRFMLHLGRGEAMSLITSALEELGYRWAYRVLNSQNFGVPQRRERVYILASRIHKPEYVLFREFTSTPLPIIKPHDVSAPVGFYWTEGTYSTGLAYDAVPPLKAGSTIGIPSPPAILMPSGIVGTPDLRDAERLQGFTENWTKPAEEVMKSSFRWKLVGNAVTVNVCKWIGQGLASPAESSIEFTEATDLKRWPEAAFGGKGKVLGVTGAYGPFKRARLGDFLRHPLKPLSQRGVAGFIGRVNKGKLAYPAGFIEALNKYQKSL